MVDTKNEVKMTNEELLNLMSGENLQLIIPVDETKVNTIKVFPNAPFDKKYLNLLDEYCQILAGMRTKLSVGTIGDNKEEIGKNILWLSRFLYKNILEFSLEEALEDVAKSTRSKDDDSYFNKYRIKSFKECKYFNILVPYQEDDGYVSLYNNELIIRIIYSDLDLIKDGYKIVDLFLNDKELCKKCRKSQGFFIKYKEAFEKFFEENGINVG